MSDIITLKEEVKPEQRSKRHRTPKIIAAGKDFNLDRAIKTIKPELSGLSAIKLKVILQREKSGAGRSSLVKHIDSLITKTSHITSVATSPANINTQSTQRVCLKVLK